MKGREKMGFKSLGGDMKKMKNNGKVAIAVMLIVALLASMAFVSAVSAHEQGIDDEKSYEIDNWSKCLKDAITDYNEAVTEGRLEDARGYVEQIDQIVTELEGFGMEVEFTATDEYQGLPTTVSVSVNPATEQKQSRGHSISANEEQLEMINQMVGENITMGELMEKVFPEVMEDMPEEIAEGFYATKMVWPDPFEPPRREDHLQAVMTKAFKSASEVQPKYEILVHHYSNMDAEWPDIDFSSTSRVWLPHPWFSLPSMAVQSYLWYQDGSLKDFEYASGTDVYEVEASGSYSTSTAGNYRVTGYHRGTYPPGADPPEYSVRSQTDWTYVGP
jgi:hypothetical protein